MSLRQLFSSRHPGRARRANDAPGRQGGYRAYRTAFNTERPGLRPLWLVLFVSVWLATIGNIALWRQLAELPDLSTWQTAQLGLALGLAITFACTALFSLLAWRWTLKPVLTLFLLSAAFGAYFMLTYNIVIDKTMMINTLQTDVKESRDLLSWGLVIDVLLMAVLPCVLVWRVRLRRAPALRQAGHNALAVAGASAMLVLTLLLFFSSVASGMRNYPQLRYLINPLNSFWAIGVIAARPFQRDDSIEMPLGEDAHPGASYSVAAGNKPPLLLLVLGETARSGNFAINGYARPTTPLLARENIASQRNAWSCGTSTAASVPCMFSDLGRADYDKRPVNQEDLLDVLLHAGLAVLWVDNQSGCKGTCEHIPTARINAADHPALCPNGECFDEVMLEGIDARIAALPAERRARGVVVVMHQMGGHGPAYYQRSPAALKKFLPECTSNALQSCEPEQLVNAYDNSIVYTDYFLSRAIDWLKRREADASTAMVYVADHGESLGENNLYLHGMPYGIAPDVQKRVPWITWLSPGFTQRQGVTTACLNKKRDDHISHDNYFHSVLGLMDVQTRVYQASLDLDAACIGATSARK